jgi:predicted RND superfamily exporter protein
VLFVLSAGMTYLATKVKLSYEFARAIPTDNPKYQAYQHFRKTFGDDGNMLVIGVQSNRLFEPKIFNAYAALHRQVRHVMDVEDVLSVPAAVNLVRDSATERLQAVRIFDSAYQAQADLDLDKAGFDQLPFYRNLLFNPETKAYVMGVRINKDSLNSPKRTKIVEAITAHAQTFKQSTGIEVHLSGLPLIRTVVADRIQQEMRWFLLGSLALSALILLLFFRSISTMLLSLAVVILGVIWSLGILQLFGYKISLLTALIPPLVVVIGIPNCIYFINKYHTAYLQKNDRKGALVEMVGKMGIVTLFCNIAAAIGFAVFALTKSAILQEFGAVAGIAIMVVFVISLILLPGVLSYLPAPSRSQVRYLNNRLITGFLLRVETWVVRHPKLVYSITGIALVLCTAGVFQLKTVARIVDDLPQNDQIYTDLRFFESNFHGVMPLEIVIDTRKKNGLGGMRALEVFERVDSLSAAIQRDSRMNRPLSLAEGLKFAKQAFFEGDTANYTMPNAFDGAFVGEYLKPSKGNSGNNLSKMLGSFMDSTRQRTRISVSMKDVGTLELPGILAQVESDAYRYFDSSKYTVELTGTSITFLEGSKFIINGLKESIFWAFLLIALCMWYLFRSWRVLVCSLIPNVIPLVITAGVMGWAGVPLKPSTVLVFSVALGIAIDITIRFLINYKQELVHYHGDVYATVRASINQTGLSIVYTSLVLVAGFVIFCFSSFGGTFALGWLTSLTLLVATLTNLILLPAIMLSLLRKKAGNDRLPHPVK